MRVIKICLGFLALSLPLAVIAKRGDMGKAKSNLRVLFMMGLLKQSQLILDPENTETTSEYYLLENLAVGLLRDDVNEYSGFKPILSESWYQSDQFTWRFKLRSGLKWSDGSPLSPRHILDHFLHIKSKPSRHLTYLKSVSSISLVEDDSSLEFHFSLPTNSGFLHELSLADAAILHESNRVRGWEITSGAYRVEKYDPFLKYLILSKNPYCPLSDEKAPDSIELFSVKPLSDLSKVFSEIPADLFSLSAHTYLSVFRQLEEKDVEVSMGIPNNIHLFEINLKNSSASNLSNREEFASIVREALGKESLDDRLSYYDQLVPWGYAGYLEDLHIINEKQNRLVGKELYVKLNNNLKEIKPIFDKIGEYGKSRNVNIKFDFSDDDNPKIDYFARYNTFKGNQKDALGTWSFLFSDSAGPFKKFFKEFRKYFDQSVSASTEIERDNFLKELHRKVLEKAIAIPFLVERSRVIHNPKLDISRWNMFDTRMRLYDLRWK